MKQVRLLALFIVWAMLCGCSLMPVQKGDGNTPAADLTPAEIAEFETEYFLPVAYVAISSENWTSPEELPGHNLVEFYMVKKYMEDLPGPLKVPFKEFPSRVDADEVEKYIKRYFDVSTERIREAENYDPKTNQYEFVFEIGGAATFNLVGGERLKNGNVILNFEYYSPADDITVIRSGELKLAPVDGGYMYVSSHSERFYD